MDRKETGALIQAYARARSLAGPDKQVVDRLVAHLGADLRDRLEALGTDVERLLAVEPAAVLAALEALEKDAAREDAGATSAANRAHVRDQDGSYDQARPQGRSRRTNGRGQGRAAPDGRGPQRGRR